MPVNQSETMSQNDVETQIVTQNKCRYCNKILLNDNTIYCDAVCEEARRIANRSYYETHKQDTIDKTAKYKKEHPEKTKKYWKNYYGGLTDEEKQLRLNNQREMKRLWAKNSRDQKKRERLGKPESYIEYLNLDNLS